ncbi:hypothetical protein [Sediminibacterium ginsengisoli]|uniref:Uncharacterized protein n=1 Tax=Sediminibacterium ginsengisoli TaxID=413434 RepID=A0A1T4QAE3_9BACT|nr:hypothetical protein [Sediminibacterium ginsengisoli]SKA00709.1 hypothetical protein SAMN04488132_1085 [Sediminibacterium ginsengisoli]
MRSDSIKKSFCLLLLFCLGLKNITYAIQPYTIDPVTEDIPVVIENVSVQEEELSLLRIVANYVDLDLEGKGRELFYYKTDKRLSSQQIRFAQDIEKHNFDVFCYSADIVHKHKLEGSNRRFSLPPHHHFLFRLTPF